MQKSHTTPLALLAAFLFSGTLAALSVSPLNPFDTVDQRVVVDVFVGESIGGVSRDHLFRGASNRRQHFREKLTAQLENILCLHGFEPDSGAEDFVGVGIWGHQIPRTNGSIEYVFFLELSVIDYDFDESAEHDCVRDFEVSRRAIGVIDDEKLEEVLISEALRLLNEQLPPNRFRKRLSPNSKPQR